LKKKNFAEDGPFTDQMESGPSTVRKGFNTKEGEGKTGLRTKSTAEINQMDLIYYKYHEKSS